jgi:hypothetical protein
MPRGNYADALKILIEVVGGFPYLCQIINRILHWNIYIGYIRAIFSRLRPTK